MNPYAQHCISPPQEPFNAEVIDTFCFHWPDMHSYVLVRVLEKTIAILPVRSRLAFLYFHHAPLPTHPSPRELRKALQPQSKRIHHMFKNWKNTLVLDEQLVTPNTPPTTPKTPSNVTLSNVLSYEPSLKTGWIHAPCTVTDDVNMYDNTIVLTTEHTVLRLTCRCFSEKMMFMNLVKLKQHLDDRKIQLDESDDSEDEQEESTSIQLMDHLQKTTMNQIDSIQQLTLRLDASKQTISTYTKQLLDLERSLDLLSENTQTIQFQSLKRVLGHVNHQMSDSINCLYSYKDRLSRLQRRILMHSDYLIRARKRYERIKFRMKDHAWYPWLYICRYKYTAHYMKD